MINKVPIRIIINILLRVLIKKLTNKQTIINVIRNFLILFLLTITQFELSSQETFTGSFEKRNQAISLTNEAIKRIANSNQSIAVDLLMEAIETDSTYREIYLQLFQAGRDNETDVDRVLNGLLIGKKVFEEDDELHFYCAEMYRLKSDTVNTILEYDKAIEYSKKNGEDFYLAPYYYLYRGNYYLNRNDFDNALEDYNYSLNLKPNFNSVLINRGICFFKLGKKIEACQDWSAANQSEFSLANEYYEKYCQDDDTVYNFVPKMPEYSGGQKGMLTYFIKNMQYPLAAYIEGVSGTAYATFIVEKDGRITDIKIAKPIGYGCDEEAERLVRSMSGWIPGELNGEKVRVKYNIPIYFKEELYPDSRIFTKTDVLPKFQEGAESLKSYIDNNKVYPESAKADSISGYVSINFVIEKDGSVTNLIVLDSLGYDCDEEAIRIIANIPKWSPGYIDSIPVRTLLNLNVHFGEMAYTVVEEMPSFKGGMQGMMNYLAENITYPLEAKKKGIQGRVFINFTILSDGSISDVKVLRGIGGGCDEEAIRVVKKMPKWNPGKQKGNPVAVKYNLPVKFSLGL
jgi:TonB family protein